jgi:hypothetical protein
MVVVFLGFATEADVVVKQPVAHDVEGCGRSRAGTALDERP